MTASSRPRTVARLAATLTVGVALIAASSASATLMAEEHFLTGDPANAANGEYDLGGVVGQAPSVDGFTGAWIQDSGTGGADAIASGLSYTDTAAQNLVSAGGALTTVGNDNGRIGRELSTGFDSTATGTYYMSFLLEVSSSGGYRAFGVADGDPTDKVFQIGTNGGDDKFIIFNTWGDTGTDRELGLAVADESNLFVLRMDLSDADDSDTLTIYRNPDDLGTEPATGVYTTSGLNLAFDHIFIEDFDNSSSQGITADEFRLGNSFADVTPVPEPASLALLGIGVALIASRRRG